MPKINPPKGTRDFYPADAFIRHHIFAAWERIAVRFGFEEYDGPLFEPLELFTRKSGPEIVSQLYLFKDKAGREMALRPELTPTLARMVAAKSQELRKPLKWYSIARLFRYEKSQRGRLREFFQFNLDILGSDSLAADAEIISLACSVLQELGLDEGKYKVSINNRELTAAIILSLGIPPKMHPAVHKIFDKRKKVVPEVLEKMYAEAGLSSNQKKKIEAVFHMAQLEDVEKSYAENEAVLKAVNKLKSLFSFLDQGGYSEVICYDPSIVRGLDYYNGIVWEIYEFCRRIKVFHLLERSRF